MTNDKNAETIYVSETAPFFRLGKVRFNDGIYRTADPKVIAEIDELIENRPDVSSVIKKVNPAEARAAAELHMRKLRSQNRAVTGSLSAADVRSMQHAALDDRDNTLKAQGVDPNQLDSEQIKADDLALTHRQPPASTPDKGFIAREQAANAAPQADSDKPADIPLQTGSEVLPTTSGDQAKGAPAKLALTPKKDG